MIFADNATSALDASCASVAHHGTDDRRRKTPRGEAFICFLLPYDGAAFQKDSKRERDERDDSGDHSKQRLLLRTLAHR